MRRRFGRGRRGQGNGAPEGRAPIDAGRALARIVETGVAGARSLERLEDPEVPDHFAVLGVGEGAEGPLLVGFAPQHGGDAALAVLAARRRLGAEAGFDGEAVAVAPQWSAAARRRLALLSTSSLRFRALAATPLAEDGEGRVEPERDRSAGVVTLRQAEAAIADPAERELFARATASLEGLAAKHGGSLRGTPEGAELVLLARRSARLRSDAGLLIETLLPDRSTLPLRREGLANALDRLEGLLRKRLNDHRVRESEEGLRGQLVPVLAARAGLRGTLAWPLPGSDPEVIDLAGIAADGVPALGAIRQRLGLVALAAILDAASALRPALAMLLSDAGPPLRLGAPRLLLAAAGFDAAVERLLPLVAWETALFAVTGGRGREPEVEPRGAEGLPALREVEPRAPVAVRESRPERAEEPRAERAERTEEPRAERAEEPFARGGEPGPGRRESRSRRRRGRRRPESPAAFREPEGIEEPGEAPEVEAAPRRFEEISLFDLEDERPAEVSGEGGGRRRRRGRRRRGGRRGGSEEAGGGSEDDEGEAGRPEAFEARDSGPEAAFEARDAGPERAAPEEDEGDDDLDLSETLAALSEDAPDLEEVSAPSYDDDEEDEGEEADEPEALEGAAALRQEREARRLARASQAVPLPEPAEAPRAAPRRRAAIVAHADRDSILAAALLARDLRLVEGVWIYPQSELMTFFRSVATDLREETPIAVVGFTASPARDTIQAATLYAGRLDWYDHHDWPPEDLEALRAAVGRERVVVVPGAGSSLPAVLGSRTRRSRFSDKLVELAGAAFTPHDYERWGRLWWHRLGELARRTGERRADLEPLLVGRPSELAREASRLAAPDPPPELAFVSRHDFRLVHFGGYALVVVPVPAELDLHLAARVARERYGAALSLAYREGSELLVLAGGENRGRQNLDLGSMVQHLAAKHRWIEALPDADFVARLRVRDLAGRPERLDEVIGEVAMGRSILEG